jgi:outer membrane lipoprotein-sorting protein
VQGISFKSLLVVFILGLSLSGCKPKEKALRLLMPDYSPAQLYKKMEENSFDFNWISAKINADITQGKKKTSFKISYRAKKDSALWALIYPPIGIEVARVLITKDSVKFLNRMNSTYFVGDFSFINSTFGVDLDYNTLESAITGNPLAVYEPEDFKSFIDQDRYLLTTTKRRKGRRAAQRSDTTGTQAYRIWVEPEKFKISKMGVYDFQTKENLEIFYSNFTPVDTVPFPFKILLKLSGENPARINLQYSKVSHDEPQSMPFAIPEKYQPLR